MTIGLVLHPYGDPTQGGSGGKFTPLIEGLIEGRPDDSFVCYLKGYPRDGARFSVGGARVAYAFLGGLPIWITGAFTLKRHDMYLFLSPVIPLFMRPKHSIVVAQDFAYLTLSPRRLRHRLMRPLVRWMHATSLRKASMILAISQATKDDMVRHFGIPSDKIRVMHLGFTAPDVSPQAIHVPIPFFLYVGALKSRKNVENSIRAFGEFAQGEPVHSFVLTGKKKGAYYEHLQGVARATGAGERIIFVGRASDEEVAYLYTQASALVFPSLFEGFGFPIIEAMHWGCPVITSNEGALQEVAGDAALLVDPRDPSSVARAMMRIATDASLRESLARKGRARAAEFTWDKSLAVLLDAVRDVLGTLRYN